MFLMKWRINMWEIIYLFILKINHKIFFIYKSYAWTFLKKWMIIEM